MGSNYVPVRHPVADGVMPCWLCDKHATFYEHPIEGDENHYYAACDEHWKEHDEMNQVSK